METHQYVPGDVITMRLMRREKGVLVALPSSQWVKVEEPIHFGGERLCGGERSLARSLACSAEHHGVEIKTLVLQKAERLGVLINYILFTDTVGDNDVHCVYFW